MNDYKFDDIVLGLTEYFKVVVTQEMHNNFTKNTNDVNPMHIDENYAKEKGFRGSLVYGMLTALFILRW